MGTIHTFTDKWGYLRDTQTKKLIHRAVCRAEEGFHFSWVVHHVNANKTDNRAENLIAMPGWLHNKIHDSYGTGNLPDKNWIQEEIDRHLKLLTGNKKLSRKKRQSFELRRWGKQVFPKTVISTKTMELHGQVVKVKVYEPQSKPNPIFFSGKIYATRKNTLLHSQITGFTSSRVIIKKK